MRPLPCWQQDSVLLTCSEIYTQIYHRAPCPAVLFFKGPKKRQRRGKIISNFTKGQTFFIFYDNQVLLKVISQCGPSSCTLQKRPSYPLHFDQEGNIPGHSIDGQGYWLALKIFWVFPVPTGRVAIGWWTLL